MAPKTPRPNPLKETLSNKHALLAIRRKLDGKERMLSARTVPIHFEDIANIEANPQEDSEITTYIDGSMSCTCTDWNFHYEEGDRICKHVKKRGGEGTPITINDFRYK